MRGIKKILFGITLILFGFVTLYVSSLGEWGFGEVIGIFIPIVGILLAIAGLLDKN